MERRLLLVMGMSYDGSGSLPPRAKRVDGARIDLLERTKQEIAERLHGVCDGMSAQEFEALVSRAAEIEIKYANRRRDALLTDRPVRGQ